MSRQLMIPAADTRLYAVDAPGGTPALLFLSGGFGTGRTGAASSAVSTGSTARCGSTPGRAGSRADRPTTPVQAAVDDIGRVIDATGIARPILVGWSHGATVAVRYAAQHPGRVRGLVLIDGAYPIAMFDEAGKQKVRTQFRRLGWIMRILAALGSLGPDVSRRVRGRRDRDGRRQRRTRTRLRGAGMPDRCSWLAPEPTRAPPRTRCARCALRPPTPRRATSACPYSQRRPTAHADPQQGPRHRGRRDRGRHPRSPDGVRRSTHREAGAGPGRVAAPLVLIWSCRAQSVRSPRHGPSRARIRLVTVSPARSSTPTARG